MRHSLCKTASVLLALTVSVALAGPGGGGNAASGLTGQPFAKYEGPPRQVGDPTPEPSVLVLLFEQQPHQSGLGWYIFCVEGNNEVADDFEVTDGGVIQQIGVTFDVETFPGNPSLPYTNFNFRFYDDSAGCPDIVSGPFLAISSNASVEPDLWTFEVDVDDPFASVLGKYGGEDNTILLASPGVRYWMGWNAAIPAGGFAWIGTATADAPHQNFESMVQGADPLDGCLPPGVDEGTADMALRFWGAPLVGGQNAMTITGSGVALCDLTLTFPDGPNGACTGNGADCVGVCTVAIANTAGLTGALLGQVLAAAINNSTPCEGAGYGVGLNTDPNNTHAVEVGTTATGLLVARTDDGQAPLYCVSSTDPGYIEGPVGDLDACGGVLRSVCGFTFRAGKGPSVARVTAGTDHYTTSDPSTVDVSLPADFFAPGSDPFVGTLDVLGVPVDVLTSNANMIVSRQTVAEYGLCNGDDDADGDVDATDVAAFNACTGATTDPCLRFDFDGDGTVEGTASTVVPVIGSSNTSTGDDGRAMGCLFFTANNGNCCPGDPTFPQTVTVPIELADLHLRAADPIMVATADAGADRWMAEFFPSDAPAVGTGTDGPCENLVEAANGLNNGIATATNLGIVAVSTTVGGRIGDSTECCVGTAAQCDCSPATECERHDVDVYKIILAGETNLQISLLGQNLGGNGSVNCPCSTGAGDAKGLIRVFDAVGVEEASAVWSAVTGDPSVSVTLAAGTHYVGVSHYQKVYDPVTPVCDAPTGPIPSDLTGVGCYDLKVNVIPGSTMSITSADASGGTFDMSMLYQLMQVYSQLCDPQRAEVVDTGDDGGPFEDVAVRLDGSGDWRRTASGGVIPGDPNFVPGDDGAGAAPFGLAGTTVDLTAEAPGALACVVPQLSDVLIFEETAMDLELAYNPGFVTVRDITVEEFLTYDPALGLGVPISEMTDCDTEMVIEMDQATSSTSGLHSNAHVFVQIRYRPPAGTAGSVAAHVLSDMYATSPTATGQGFDVRIDDDAATPINAAGVGSGVQVVGTFRGADGSSLPTDMAQFNGLDPNDGWRIGIAIVSQVCTTPGDPVGCGDPLVTGRLQEWRLIVSGFEIPTGPKVLPGDVAAGTWNVASGDVVWHQPFHIRADNFVGTFSDYNDELAADGGRQAADSFRFLDDTQVTDIHWRGGYGGNGEPQVADQFTVQIWSTNSASGLPGSVLVEEGVGSGGAGTPIVVSRVGGQMLGRGDGRHIWHYSYNLTSPFNAGAFTKYWISVINNTEPTTDFWFFCFAQDGRSDGLAASRDVALGAGAWGNEGPDVPTDYSFDLTTTGETWIICGDSVASSCGEDPPASGLGYWMSHDYMAIEGFEAKGDNKNQYKNVVAPWKRFEECIVDPPALPDSAAVQACLASLGINEAQEARIESGFGAKLVSIVFEGLAAYDAELATNGVRVSGDIRLICEDRGVLATEDAVIALDEQVQVAGMLFDNGTSSFIVKRDACEGCSISMLSASTLKSHTGCPDRAIAINTTATASIDITSETRGGCPAPDNKGIGKLRVTLSGDGSACGVGVASIVNDLGATIPSTQYTVTFDGPGTTMDIVFSPNLPNNRVYTVTLAGITTGDADFKVRSMLGNVVADAGSQQINALDIGLSGIRGQFGCAPCTGPVACVKSDINLDGSVNSLDFSAVRLTCGVFGSTAP